LENNYQGEIMRNTMKRILTGAGMVTVASVAAIAEYHKIPVVRWLAVLIAALMVFETMRLKIKNIKLCALRVAFGAWLILVGVAGYFVGTKPWIMLLLLFIIAAADTGAWFFGRKLGGDKMQGLFAELPQRYFTDYSELIHLCPN
jgi:CDP-diglyceride synthetase